MNSWIVALSIAVALMSLALIWKRQRRRVRRLTASLLQLAIWALVWALWQLPALLPAPQRATLQVDLDTVVPTPVSESRSLAQPQVAQLKRLVLDTGLERDALRDLPPVRLDVARTAQPAPTERSAHWPRQLHLGEPLQIAVTGIEPDTRVSLEDPFGTVVDSANSTDGGRVQLRGTPKLAGRWLYRLRIHSADGEARQPVPVTVHGAERPTVLLWLARADFESAALSRWLRQSGVRSQVITHLAPDVVRRQSYNGVDDVPDNPLDPAGPFDLLILDSHLWPQLSQVQRTQLGEIAAEKSLLWLTDTDSPAGFLDYARTHGMALQAGTPVETESPLPQPPQEIPLLLLTGYQPNRPLASDVTLDSRTGTAYWARNSRSQSVGYVLFGRSHRWITSGHAAEFARLWKTLLDHQLAHRGGRAPLSLQNPLPRAGRRMTLCGPELDGSVRLSPLENRSGDRVSLAGVPASNNADGNCYSYWPQRAGWYGLAKKGNEDDRAFYIFAEQDWPLWQGHRASADSRQMATARLGPPPVSGDIRTPLPRPWIALALLLLLSLTWLLERRTLKS